MKNLLFTSRILLLNTFVAVLALALLLTPTAFAQDATNLAADTASNAGTQAIPGSQNGNTTNVLGLPPETLNRLSPDQIITLMQQRMGPPYPRRSPTFMQSAGEILLNTLVPLGVFAMIVTIVALGVGQKLKRNKLFHETLRMMIEKGQPIPPELLQRQEAAARPRSDLRTGLVFIAVGLGLLLMSLVGNTPGMVRGVAFIPMLMGAAFLIAWKIESKKNGGQPK